MGLWGTSAAGRATQCYRPNQRQVHSEEWSVGAGLRGRLRKLLGGDAQREMAQVGSGP